MFEINPITHGIGCVNRYQRSDKPDRVPPRSVKLLDQVRERIRYLHYSLQTEKAYVYWAKAFVLWTARSHGGFRYLREMGHAEVEGFLTMLATEKQVASATHRHPLAASRHRHPNGAGVVGAFGRVHDHDLHACAEGGGGWDGQPTGCDGICERMTRFAELGGRTAPGRNLPVVCRPSTLAALLRSTPTPGLTLKISPAF